MNVNFETIVVRTEENIGYIQFNRPQANNTINGMLISECHRAMDELEDSATVIVFEGLPQVFCFGADFASMHNHIAEGDEVDDSSVDRLYALWERIATGPFITVCHARGKTNAGGMGFVSACDIVLAQTSATFSFSELLFGIYPSCVIPFMMRKTGFQKTNYLTLTTKAVSAQEAFEYHLVDAVGEDSNVLLRKHLLRLRRLNKEAVARYKAYINQVNPIIEQSRESAIMHNKAMHSYPGIMEGICRFVESGKLPWE